MASDGAIDSQMMGMLGLLAGGLVRGGFPSGALQGLARAMLIVCRSCSKTFRSGPFDEIDKQNILRFEAQESDCDPRLCESCCESQITNRRPIDDGKTIDLNKSDYEVK